MGKKRKKSPDQMPESPVSQPALSEEKAAELLAADSPDASEADEMPEITETPAPVVAKSAEPTHEPSVVIEPTPTPMVAAAELPGVARAETTEPPPASEAAPSTARPKKRKKKRSTKPPVSRAVLDQKIDRLEAKLEVKKEEAAKAAREGFGSNPALDDQSVPPVDLEVHDEFFAAGEKVQLVRDASGNFSALDARHAQKMTPHAHARRAHLSRYVKWSVGMAAGILLLGFGIKAMRGHPNDEPVRHEITHVAAQPSPVEQQAAPQPKIDTPQVVEITEKVDDTKTDEAKLDDKLAAADAKAPDEVEKKEDMPPEKPKNAWQEKQAAKAALERGANAVAISAGERSVALDPSDGEAWLVLGGAYQAMGNAGQAKRCYNACVSQGKKGPIGDCRDMLSAM